MRVFCWPVPGRVERFRRGFAFSPLQDGEEGLGPNALLDYFGASSDQPGNPVGTPPARGRGKEKEGNLPGPSPRTRESRSLPIAGGRGFAQCKSAPPKGPRRTAPSERKGKKKKKVFRRILLEASAAHASANTCRVEGSRFRGDDQAGESRHREETSRPRAQLPSGALAEKREISKEFSPSSSKEQKNHDAPRGAFAPSTGLVERGGTASSDSRIYLRVLYGTPDLGR